ncbi:Cas9 endonuclease PAM-interacting domain-containing protein [Pediococcus damnosus]|uniref:Cas9 endonuclease PAM-interacting domain-containing protein n=1 Tax=Pediococcus damnosus TaxID=51663 RepID=UPI003F6AE4A4
MIETTDDFKIVVSKVRFQQLIDDAGQFFMLASDTYKNNAQQLVISNNALKAINNTNITDCPRDDLERLDNLRLDSAFDEIVKKWINISQHMMPIILERKLGIVI